MVSCAMPGTSRPFLRLAYSPESMANMIKRIAKWILILACVYLGLTFAVLALYERVFGVGVYRKGHGYISR